MHDPSGDLRRLEDALDFEWRLTGLACDVRVLQQLQPALRKGGWKVTVAVHGGSQIIAVWPGFASASTASRSTSGRRRSPRTCATCRAASRRAAGSDESADPLRRRPDEPRLVGHDESRRRKGTDRDRARCDQRARRRCRATGRDSARGHLEATFVGNPIMHHLLLGISPLELGGAPFALATDSR
jgi:hypothetical protein